MRRNTFTIPGNPALEVAVSETDDGDLLFKLTVVGTKVGDLRGLFFDIANSTLLSNLMIEGHDVTDTRLAASAVLDLGNGANLNGSGAAFDVGVEFGTQGIGKDDIRTTSFVLSTKDGSDLTLDLVSNVDFGARITSIGSESGARNDSEKIRTISTAAPDAIDDSATTKEDTPITVNVLGNDTDADADTLTISALLDGPDHGTVEIVDNKLVYTPGTNYSGSDSIVYEIFDGSFGYDQATLDLTVVAVADPPNLSVEIQKGVPQDAVNVVTVDIGSSLVDTDGSESITRLIIENIPSGVTVSGAIFDMASGHYLIDDPAALETITLTLPEGQDTDFDLKVTAVSTEASNHDTATTTQSVDIVYDFNQTSFDKTFEATGRSMWSDNTAFEFTNSQFFGIDYDDSFSAGDEHTGASGSLDLKAGLQSDFFLSGGTVDAEVPFSFDFGTSYNKATDVLRIDTDADLLSGGSFQTDGPFATYHLDFVFELDWNLFVEIIDLTLLNLGGSENFVENIIDYDSRTDPPLSVEILTGVTVDFQWPELDTTSTEGTTGSYSSSGNSNNALQLNFDVDDIAFALLGLPNPLGGTIDLFSEELGTGVLFNWDILDLDLFAGLNFLQDFSVTVDESDVHGTLTTEDGVAQAFDFGDSLTYYNASSQDVNSNGDLEFDVDLDLEDVVMSNLTSLGFNVGGTFKVLEVSGKAGVFGLTDDFQLGPVYQTSFGAPVASIPVFDSDFNLTFADEGATLVV